VWASAGRLSFATLLLVIALATSRVFCRLPPGSVQPAAAAALTGAGALPVPAGVVVPATACLPKHCGVLALLLLPQPATARPATTARDTPVSVLPAVLMAASPVRMPNLTGQVVALRK
jgi:hypothetical protein